MSSIDTDTFGKLYKPKVDNLGDALNMNNVDNGDVISGNKNMSVFTDLTDLTNPKGWSAWSDGNVTRAVSPLADTQSLINSGFKNQGTGTAEWAKAQADGGAGATAPDGSFTDSIGNMFTSKNMGTTMQGIGAIGSAVGGVMQANAMKDYQNKVLNLEQGQQNYVKQLAAAKQANYDKVCGNSNK